MVRMPKLVSARCDPNYCYQEETKDEITPSALLLGAAAAATGAAAGTAAAASAAAAADAWCFQIYQRIRERHIQYTNRTYVTCQVEDEDSFDKEADALKFRLVLRT